MNRNQQKTTICCHFTGQWSIEGPGTKITLWMNTAQWTYKPCVQVLALITRSLHIRCGTTEQEIAIGKQMPILETIKSKSSQAGIKSSLMMCSITSFIMYSYFLLKSKTFFDVCNHHTQGRSRKCPSLCFLFSPLSKTVLGLTCFVMRWGC